MFALSTREHIEGEGDGLNLLGIRIVNIQLRIVSMLLMEKPGALLVAFKPVRFAFKNDFNRADIFYRNRYQPPAVTRFYNGLRNRYIFFGDENKCRK